MDQSSRLEGLTRVFAGHLVRRQSPQFGIDEREQLLGGLDFVGLHRVKDRQLAWSFAENRGQAGLPFRPAAWTMVSFVRHSAAFSNREVASKSWTRV